jgi:hypothetical protein
LTTPGVVTANETHQDLIDWLIKQQIAFKTAFRARIDALSDEIWLRELTADDEPLASSAD